MHFFFICFFLLAKNHDEMEKKFAELENTIINQVNELNNVLIKEQPQMLIIKIKKSDIVKFFNIIINWFPSKVLNDQYTIASYSFKSFWPNGGITTIESLKFMYQVYDHSSNEKSSNHIKLHEFSYLNEKKYELYKTNNSEDNKQRDFNISIQNCQPKLAFFTNTNLHLEEYKLISEFISYCLVDCDTTYSYICLYLYNSKDIIAKIDEYYNIYNMTSAISKGKSVFDLKEFLNNNSLKIKNDTKKLNFLYRPYFNMCKADEKKCLFDYGTLFYSIKYDIINNNQFGKIKKPIDISLWEENLNSIYRLYFKNFLGQQTIYFFVIDKINEESNNEKIVYVSSEDSHEIKFKFLICKNYVSNSTIDEEKDGMDNFVKNLTKLIKKNIKNFNDYKNEFNFNKTCFN